jgi:hypothetical protein
VAIEEAVSFLSKRLQLLGALDPDAAARDFIDWQRRQGWRPFAPITALPPRDHTRPADPARVADLASDVRAVIRATRQTQPAEEGE